MKGCFCHFNGYEVKDAKARTDIERLNGDAERLTNEMNVERARVDSLTRMEEGSTTGDAELIDARVDYKGEEWENVGAHIRGVSNQLFDVIKKYTDTRNCFDANNLINGFLDYSTGEVVENASWKCTDFIECETYDRVLGASSNGKDLVALCFYDESKKFIGKHFATTKKEAFEHIIVTPNTKYLRYNVAPENMCAMANQYLNIVSSQASREAMETAISSYWQITNEADVIKNNCANLDALPINSIITYTYNAMNAVNDKPFNKGFTIVTLNSLTNNYAGAVQIAIDLANGDIATRVNAGEWTAWKGKASNGEVSNIYYVGKTRNGNNTFITLKDCTEYIINNNIYNATVYIDAETFDLVSEYGVDYLDNITSETNKGFGLHIGNNTHFIFAEGSKVLFNYQGTNEDCAEFFSPFNIIGSFTLENANIEATNARYCVHEDLPTSADVIPSSYIAKYINCTMKHNANTIGEYTATVCIGAGTQKNSLSIIDGGKYECFQFPYAISYHNCNSGYPSKVIVKNAWLNNGLRFADFGVGNYVDVIISGCHIPNGYTEGDYFNITEWNNDITQ